MPKFLWCRATTLVLIISLAAGGLEIEPRSYAALLSHMRERYKSAGIFLLYDDNSERLGAAAAFLKLFSLRGAQSQAIHYSRLRDKSRFRATRNCLHVVFLESRRNLDDFRGLLAMGGASRAWLLIFAAHVDEETSEMCRRPAGNPFRLAFNSRLTVKCHGDDELRDWYSINGNSTVVARFATWSPRTGLLSVNKNVRRERYDLNGTTLSIATLTKPRESPASSNRITVFLEQLLAELSVMMNFKVARAREASSFGKWDSARAEWSGFMSFLARGQVDLAVAPITITSYRQEFADFTVPLLLCAKRIYVRQPQGSSIRWSAYFRAFSPATWTSIALVLLAAALMTAFIRATNAETASELSLGSVIENGIRIWGIYCQQGLSDFPNVTSLRLAYFTMLLLALVIWAVYSASITSYLTVLSANLPFSDVKGFARAGSYKVIVLQNSSDEELIMSGSDPELSLLRPLLMQHDRLPQDPVAAFKEVCEKRVGFYTTDLVLRAVRKHVPCRLKYVDTGEVKYAALGLPKNSPYTAAMNYNIQRLIHNGVMSRLKNWYEFPSDGGAEGRSSPIGLPSIAPLLAIFGTGCALSILILLGERLRRAVRSQRLFH